jgi:DNA-binding NtrC family response regulator
VAQSNGHATVPVVVTGGSPTLRDHVEREVAVLGAVLTTERPAVVIVVQDENPAETSIGSVALLRQRYPGTPLVFVATRGSEQLAVAAFRAGAADYISWPVHRTELAQIWGRLVTPPRAVPEPFFLGQGEAIARARDQLQRFAVTGANVLITGETGTGKELAAKWLHRLSGRAAEWFVSVSCAAVGDSPVANDARADDRARPAATTISPERLVAADGGTVFLDQVGELSLTVQASLLRVVERREVVPPGTRSPQPVNLRWISATSSDLGALVREGRFRPDLYYHLNAAEVSLPPLRERPEDIADLAEGFLAASAVRLGERPRHLSAAALECLLAHDWPGNVRELRNAVESSAVRAESSEILVRDLPPGLQPANASRTVQASLERRRVLDALHATAGNKTEAARRLNWSRMTLYRKLMRHQIPVTAPRTPAAGLSPRL